MSDLNVEEKCHDKCKLCNWIFAAIAHSVIAKNFHSFFSLFLHFGTMLKGVAKPDKKPAETKEKPNKTPASKQVCDQLNRFMTSLGLFFTISFHVQSNLH